MEFLPQLFFAFFALLAVGGALALVFFRNPVSSALSMVVAFVGLAGLFIGLQAYFVGIVQILVYSGAIMVLFLFIIMLLNLKEEDERKNWKGGALFASVVLPLLLVIQLYAVLQKSELPAFRPLDFQQAALLRTTVMPPQPGGAASDSPAKAWEVRGMPSGPFSIVQALEEERLPDTQLIGEALFAGGGSVNSWRGRTLFGYPLALQITAAILLVATIGVVVLSLRARAVAAPPASAGTDAGTATSDASALPSASSKHAL